MLGPHGLEIDTEPMLVTVTPTPLTVELPAGFNTWKYVSGVRNSPKSAPFALTLATVRLVMGPGMITRLFGVPA